MNPTIIPINYIERKPNSDKYRIVGKGVTVEFLAQFINDPEWSIERICENYNLPPADVHSAWAFYYDHQDEIDNRLQAIQANDELYSDENLQRREQLMARRKANADETGEA
jgi:uncharacterized protein (DUF433 family)